MDVEELEEIEKDKTGLFRWEDLVDRIQASDEELRAGLRALSVVEIDGYWRIEDEVVGMLEADGFPRRLALHCLEVYGGQVGEGNGSNGRAWVLDERRVCIHFARVVLKGGKMKVESFMDEWMKKILAGMPASFEMLEGEVLVERLGVETWICAFSKWEWKDLQPYIRDLRIPGFSSEELLLKYTQKMQPTSDAEPIFNAR
uniref:Sister chromatid cohesion protein DCC1 n=1 Tax=Nelumbo nucifera TaxID=4432 RepID=A0A822YXW0_NELNU|nr:TPA_asm: hypothetical protein HUJ06_006992 [Nelumbo nucifera]